MKLEEFKIANVEIIDEEEFEYLKSLKVKKQQYRQLYEQLQGTRGEVEYVSKLVNRCREKLLMDFETWYSNTFSHEEPQTNDNDAPDPELEQPSEDVLDYQEKFDKMLAEKILQEDPESAYFYNARKTVLNVRKTVRLVSCLSDHFLREMW